MSIPSVEELKSIVLEKLTTVPEERDVNAAIEHLAASHPQLSPVLLIRPTRNGDVVIIDFVGSVDGVEFPGGSAQDYALELGSGSFIPGFEEQLVNRNTGDVVNVRVPFPEDYQEKSLAGKKAVFRCTIKAMKQKKAAVVDDEFAKNFGLESLAAMREAIVESLQENIEEAAQEKMQHDVMEILVDRFPAEPPADIVEKEMEMLMKHDADLKEEEARKIASRRAAQGMILVDLAKANGVTVTDEEVMEALKAEIQKYGPQAPQILNFYRSNPQMLSMFRAGEMEKKALKWVLDHCSVEEKKVSGEEFQKAMTIEG